MRTVASLLFFLCFAASTLAQPQHRLVFPGLGGATTSEGVPIYDTITASLNAAHADRAANLTQSDVITIYKGPGGANPEHRLNGSVPGSYGSEPNNLIVTIDNVTLQGATYSDGHIVTINGVGTLHGKDFGLVLGGNNNIVRNLRFIGCRMAGIEATGSHHVIENVTCEYNYRNGIEVRSSDTQVRDCAFRHTIMYSNSSTPAAAAGCNIRAARCTVDDCVASDNGQDGFRFLGLAQDCTVTDCISKENHRQGLLALGSQGLKIIGTAAGLCVFHNNDDSGIQIENGANDVVIRNVTSRDNNEDSASEAGIWIDCSTNVLIEDCKIYDNRKGMIIDSDPPQVAPQPASGTGNFSEDVIVRFNKIYDNTKNIVVPFQAAQNGGGITLWRTKRVAVYHNTIWNNNTSEDPQNGNGINKGFDRGGFGEPLARPGLDDFVTQQSNFDITFKNNVVGKIHGQASAHMMQFYMPPSLVTLPQIKELSRNVYHSPPTVDAYHLGTLYKSFADYKSHVAANGGHETGSERTIGTPVHASSNLVPRTNYFAHNTAYALTDVSFASSGFIGVSNPHFFRKHDKIRFTDSNAGGVSTGTAEIEEITGSVLQVSSMPSNGAAAFVWLDRSGVAPFVGSAPDIGAVESSIP